MLIGEGEVLDHAQAVPSRRQDRPPHLLLRQAIEDAKHMVTLLIEETQQQLSLLIHPTVILSQACSGSP
jgi:hypothetical protein